MFKRGMVLGKFYPFHEGHKFLIKTAYEQCEELLIFLCTQPSESIDGRVRYEAMRKELTQPRLHVLWIDREMPQYPHEADDFWEQWVTLVKERAPDIDVIFTSEIYGDAFAKHLGIHHIQLPIDRRDVTVSGTAVRHDAFAQWDNIPQATKAQFVKTICLMGAESVGKTTLAERLAKHYNTIWVPEYGRTFVDTLAKGKLAANDFVLIALMQDRLIQNAKEEVAAKNGKYLFVDTDVMTTWIFSRLYEASIEKAADSTAYDIFSNMIAYQNLDLYVLLDANGTKWVQDGQREFEDRMTHQSMIKDMLKWHKKKYVIISGPQDTRFEQAIEAIDKL
jgi:HTH-type transcriptional regulator, transcriptional repressor of NAD biosynthesis genes